MRVPRSWQLASAPCWRMYTAALACEEVAGHDAHRPHIAHRVPLGAAALGGEVPAVQFGGVKGKWQASVVALYSLL
jgi:hypothetical protein